MTTMTTTPEPTRPGDPDAYPVLTVLMLMLGGFVLPVVGWLAGVVMLWTGRSWTVGEKWLGTLVWPGIVAVPALVLAVGLAVPSEPGAGHWAIIVAGIVGVLGALVVLPWTFVRLLRAARPTH
ncbi:hypothetical protein Ae406Ps2_3458c [Pseudonocardia sp. Ae406_Ps2]|jgi:hypothetical protein|uniref:hypothetical protein n=1 Tax=unclassified Pseudonocardia TaxID=2619320 RepID=UPI00031F5ED4|nr:MULTISPECIES: hypothetical protein [unclassified Pseudonocardia]OLL98803.1 hypothetical protein Ae331Ps2_2470 [Pseudonocardia sp. Ae331_Ps2]OLM03458.1 hypothetical protein Ae406Ps2_3458c [Pseudonocardia sp. Ae406_Ps2]OLM11658.1 hypothetical protein Ae505Ps2_1783 [Pseudonocardia sp. Ae505_Ps2]OLM25016.1 hypothetical protein Ae706Ps2_3449c [Pseudonocardia sp. Ae706_Ps2]OLM34755.1 hypothetical protein Ae717Ps2_5651 [Pseudonocardia sp. Ae717_Ps2]